MISLQSNEDEIELQEGDLTAEELQAFKQAAATGKLAGLVQPWVPWWTLPEAAEVQLSSSGTSKVIAQGTSGKTIAHPYVSSSCVRIVRIACSPLQVALANMPLTLDTS